LGRSNELWLITRSGVGAWKKTAELSDAPQRKAENKNRRYMQTAL
jgi:hypothetical protein